MAAAIALLGFARLVLARGGVQFQFDLVDQHVDLLRCRGGQRLGAGPGLHPQRREQFQVRDQLLQLRGIARAGRRAGRAQRRTYLRPVLCCQPPFRDVRQQVTQVGRRGKHFVLVHAPVVPGASTEDHGDAPRNAPIRRPAGRWRAGYRKRHGDPVVGSRCGVGHSRAQGYRGRVRCVPARRSRRGSRALHPRPQRRARQPPSAETAELLNALARIHHDRGDYPQAAQASQQAWDIARRVATTRGQQETADALNNLARVDLAQGRYAAALAKFRQAHDLLTDDGRPTLASAVITQNLGAAYDYLGDLPAALTHYQQALDTMVALGGSPARRAGCMNNIATIHHENGEFDAALRLLDEALELCRVAGLVAVGATVLLNMGQILVDRGELQQGVDRIEAALRIRQAMAARSVAVASAQESLARAYLAVGLSDEAAAQARAAVDIQAEQASGSAGHATSLATLGAVQRAAGDFDAALRLQRQALTIHEAIQPDSLGVATDLNNIGLIYHDLGDLRRAARYYTRALPLYQARSPRSATTATIHNNLGVVQHALGDLDGALYHLEIAVALDRQAAARSPAVATDLMNIASVLLTRGEHQRALGYLNEAVDLDSAASPDSPARAASLAALATTLAQDGQLDAALPLARQAIDIDRRSAPRSDRMLSDLTLLGDLLVRHGAPAAAIEVLTEAVDLVDSIGLRSGTDERRREFALADRHATYRHLIAALLRRGHEGDAEAAFLYSERARARSLNDRLAREAATGEQPGDILRLLAEEEQLRRRLSILRRAPAVPQALSPPEEAARGNGERERLEARLDDVRRAAAGPRRPGRRARRHGVHAAAGGVAGEPGRVRDGAVLPHRDRRGDRLGGHRRTTPHVHAARGGGPAGGTGG